MQRKRVVLISILFIISAIPLLSSTLSVAVAETSTSTILTPDFIILSDTAPFAQDNFTIDCPSELITKYKDSKVNLIVWTITDNTTDTLTFDVLRNGSAEYSGAVEEYPFLQSVFHSVPSVPVYYSVPISEMDYGTYNYTLVVTDGVEVKSAAIFLDLSEGTENTSNLVFDTLVFLGFTSGFTILSLAFLFGFSSLKQYYGGIKHTET